MGTYGGCWDCIGFGGPSNFISSTHASLNNMRHSNPLRYPSNYLGFAAGWRQLERLSGLGNFEAQFKF